jgi:hypothetical protein
VLAQFLAGCATMKVTEFHAQPVATYAVKAEQKGLSIAAHPMTAREEIKKAFRKDLREKGLLPILIIAENHNSSASFILAKEKVFVKNVETDTNELGRRGKVASSTAGEATALAGAAVTSPAMVIIGLKLASDAQVVEHNLSDKEFYSRTLGPGQKAQGFIYFQLPKDASLSDKHRVVVEAVEAATRETLTFTFNLR